MFPFFPDKGVEPLANQQPQDLLAFHLWDDLTAPFLWLPCPTKIILKREWEKNWTSLENSSESDAERTEHDPDHSWFLPLASVSNGPLWTHGHDADTSAPHYKEDLKPSQSSAGYVFFLCAY